MSSHSSLSFWKKSTSAFSSPRISSAKFSSLSSTGPYSLCDWYLYSWISPNSSAIEDLMRPSEMRSSAKVLALLSLEDPRALYVTITKWYLFKLSSVASILFVSPVISPSFRAFSYAYDVSYPSALR